MSVRGEDFVCGGYLVHTCSAHALPASTFWNCSKNKVYFLNVFEAEVDFTVLCFPHFWTPAVQQRGCYTYICNSFSWWFITGYWIECPCSAIGPCCCSILCMVDALASQTPNLCPPPLAPTSLLSVCESVSCFRQFHLWNILLTPYASDFKYGICPFFKGRVPGIGVRKAGRDQPGSMRAAEVNQQCTGGWGCGTVTDPQARRGSAAGAGLFPQLPVSEGLTPSALFVPSKEPPESATGCRVQTTLNLVEGDSFWPRSAPTTRRSRRWCPWNVAVLPSVRLKSRE